MNNTMTEKNSLLDVLREFDRVVAQAPEDLSGEEKIRILCNVVSDALGDRIPPDGISLEHGLKILAEGSTAEPN